MTENIRKKRKIEKSQINQISQLIKQNCNKFCQLLSLEK
jgi:hypothetical protein